MLQKLCKTIMNIVKLQVLERGREDFYQSINRINIARGKITAITFIAIESIILIVTLI
ncbi:MAG: hypothetical protein PHF63_08360 [Herbinix sp.]|nr:hypothetical protein [Herbinix sp.]